MRQSLDDEKLIKRAFTAYQKAGGNMQPSPGSCSVEQVDGEIYVILRNSYNILAVYRYRKDALMRVTEWPASIN